MNTVTPNLTPIFSGGMLIGYVLTINGEIIARQLSCEIKTPTNAPATATITFALNDEMLNGGRIDR